jgi:hypothetical protein
VIGVRGFAFHDTIRAARRQRRAGAANAEWFVSKESIESVGTHTIGSVVPALAQNARTGHPSFRSWKRRRIRSVGHPSKGKGFTATVKVTFTIDVLWGTQGQLAHENGHLAILENYFNGRTQDYSKKYEHVYSSQQDCENAAKDIAKDIARDWSDMNKQQEEHEDWMENTIQWIFNKFSGH